MIFAKFAFSSLRPSSSQSNQGQITREIPETVRNPDKVGVQIKTQVIIDLGTFSRDPWTGSVQSFRFDPVFHRAGPCFLLLS